MNTTYRDRTDTYLYNYRQTTDYNPDHSILFVLDYPAKCRNYAKSATVLRCNYLARNRGYKSFELVYLFAYRAINQKELLRATDPIGGECDLYILDAVKRSSVVVSLWGNNRHYTERANHVTNLLKGVGVTPIVLC